MTQFGVSPRWQRGAPKPAIVPRERVDMEYRRQLEVRAAVLTAESEANRKRSIQAAAAQAAMKIVAIPKPPWRTIIDECCAARDMTTADFWAGLRCRRANFKEVRWMVMYRLRVDLHWSLPKIAARLGFDHTTVLHGIKKYCAKLEIECPVGKKN